MEEKEAEISSLPPHRYPATACSLTPAIFSSINTTVSLQDTINTCYANTDFSSNCLLGLARGSQLHQTMHNYTTASRSVVLTVSKKVATVTLTGLNHSYDGSAKSPTATTNPAGLVVTSTYNGITTTPIDAGTYSVTVSINDPFYQGSASGSLLIAKAPQSITFSSIPDRKMGSADFTPNATASSGLAVVYSSSNPSVITIVNGKLHLVGTGITTITANQAGNANYTAAAPVSQNLAVGYNGAPPILTVSALSDGATTTEATQNISGMATDVNGIASVAINGTSVKVSPNGSFSYPVQLLTGANSIKVVATNRAGIATSNSRTLTLDNTAPRLVVTYPPDNGVVYQKQITVAGSIAALFNPAKETTKSVAADPTLVVNYSINGSSPQAASLTDTTYSFTAYLDDGMNTIQVSASNATGKNAAAKRTVNYQLPTFSLAIADSATDVHLALGSYVLRGVVADNSTPVAVTITMDDQSFTPTVTNGAFSQQLSFTEDKTYQVSVTGADQNNNSLTVQRNFIHTASKAADGTTASTPFSIADALQALQMTAGIVMPDSDQIKRMDVAPMVNGISVGDGKVDIEDVLIILYMAVGLIH